jgi:hypothetical protein
MLWLTNGWRVDAAAAFMFYFLLAAGAHGKRGKHPNCSVVEARWTILKLSIFAQNSDPAAVIDQLWRQLALRQMSVPRYNSAL